MTALMTALPGGYIRLFLDESIPARRLLAHLKTDDPRLAAYLRRILFSSVKPIQILLACIRAKVDRTTFGSGAGGITICWCRGLRMPRSPIAW